MTHPIIQVDYDQLADIARRFEGQAGASQQMRQRLQRGMTALQNGGWAGVAAEAFCGEMDAEIFPALARLEAALEQAAAVTRQISAVMRQAEEEAAAPFRGAAEGVASGGDGPSGDGASAGDGTGLVSSQNLVVIQPTAIFNEAYMESFIGSGYEGQNSVELNQLMEDLVRARNATGPEIDRKLDRIAEIRGVDPATFRAQHQTYLQLLENGKVTGGNYPGIDLDRHGNFLGSTVSLRYGAVVGEVFGIDPVFGSLLNPTGGLVGPSSDSYHPADNDAIGYHGVFHDAAGYLYNYQDIGPGYDYLDREPFPTDNPLTGQLGGVSYWVSHLDMDANIPTMNIPDFPGVPRFAEVGLAGAIDVVGIPLLRANAALTDGNNAIADGIGDVFAGDISEGVNDIGAGLGTIATGLSRTVLDIFD